MDDAFTPFSFFLSPLTPKYAKHLDSFLKTYLWVDTEIENKAVSIGQLLYHASPFPRRASLFFFLLFYKVIKSQMPEFRALYPA